MATMIEEFTLISGFEELFQTIYEISPETPSQRPRDIYEEIYERRCFFSKFLDIGYLENALLKGEEIQHGLLFFKGQASVEYEGDF